MSFKIGILIYNQHSWSHNSKVPQNVLTIYNSGPLPRTVMILDDLPFSAGQWEGEALQAEKTGQWALLCVEDQEL